MATSIPTSARNAVYRRDGGCVRCGASGPLNFHHRRRRGIRDEHTNCACNGLSLCGSGTTGCHGWVTVNPLAAREAGLIVSSYHGNPAEVPIKTIRGWVLHDCTGQRVMSAPRT